MYFIDYLAKKSPPFIWGIALLMNLVIGVIDYLTGYEIGMEVFYLLPIGLLSWFVNRNAGIIMSVISTVTFIIANLLAGQVIEDYFSYSWNIFIHVGIFIVVAYLISVERIISDNNRTLIGKLQQSLEALRDSEEKFRTIFENSSSAMAIIERDTTISMVNREYCKIGLFEEKDVIGRSWTTQIPPGDLERLQEYNRQRLIDPKSAPDSYEFTFYRKDGKIRHSLMSVAVIPTSQNIVCSFVDITERKQAEEELKKAETRYRIIFENAVEGIYQSTPDGRFLQVNPAMARIYGCDSPADMEQSITDIATQVYVNPDDRKHLIETLENNDHIEKYEYQVRKKNGDKIWVSNNARVVRDDEGKILYYEGLVQDITERKLMEEALRESEERFRLMVETTQDIIYIVDRKGFITYVNPTTERILGYTHHELEGKSFEQVVAPECIDSVKDRFKKAMRGDSLPIYEADLIRKDGTSLPVEFNAVTIHDNKGKTSGRYGIGRDITVRKQAEEALRESESVFRRMFDQSPVGVAMVGLDFRFLGVNEAFCRITGYQAAELTAMGFSDITHPDDLTDSIQKSLQLQAGVIDQFDMDKRYIRKDGGIIWAHLSVRPVRDASGKPVYFLPIIEDITDRKEAEEALRESEDRYRSLFDSSSEAILLTAPDGRILAANSEACRIFGRTEEEICRIGRTGLMDTTDPRLAAALEERALTGQFRGELTFIRKNGASFPGEISSTIFRDRDGNSKTSMIIRDITDQKLAEEERKALQERLQRAEKMEALGTLAGGVAHDLNNVLGVVVGYAELLLMDAEKSSSIRPGLVKIMNGGRRAAAIVQDLLTLARRGVPGREVLNLNKIIADCQQAPEFEKLSSYHSAVKIKADLEPDLLNISGSSVHLGKTLFNLVSNASESMPNGGIVTIKTANQYLDKSIHGYDEVREGDYVVLSVSDTGEGISSNDLERIFEPFYTKKVMGRSGTGLGLAVVWGTVKDHKGYINVESEEGKGSIFTLYFPVTRKDISAEAITISISEYMGKGESILIVDDVKDQSDLAAGMLSKLNYNVSSVSSGEEAIAYLKDKTVDLIVLDMIMDPGMDGLDTYRSILEIHPKQKAIIVSGFSETDRVHAAQSLGAGAYIRKPYVIEKLGLAVKKELDRK